MAVGLPSASGGSSPGRASSLSIANKAKAGSKYAKSLAKTDHAWPKISSEIYAQQYPGALPLESEVFCWYRARHCWFSATIIYARAIDPTAATTTTTASKAAPATTDGSVVSEAASSAASSTAVSSLSAPHHRARHVRLAQECPSDMIAVKPFAWQQGEAGYEYYVHFHGEDRRQDLWVVAAMLRPKDFAFDPAEPHLIVPPGPDEIHRHMDAEYLREHEENTKLKTIVQVFIDDYIINAWYFSPYPKEYQNLETLFLCPFCLEYFRHEVEMLRHKVLCTLRHPPGDEIYRHPETLLSVFEVDGSVSKRYAENLCLLSKLFLDHKTLRHPVYLFLFYILTEYVPENDSYRLVAYFSKEKYSKNNLSCIMCLPQHQRKGYGQFLINLSYALSYREKKRGTPERPLSDLGKATYYKYWGQTAVSALLSAPLADCESVSLEDIAQQISVNVEDIAVALDSIGVLRSYQDFASTTQTPYLFLPDIHMTAIKQWARPAFAKDSLLQELLAGKPDGERGKAKAADAPQSSCSTASGGADAPHAAASRLRATGETCRSKRSSHSGSTGSSRRQGEGKRATLSRGGAKEVKTDESVAVDVPRGPTQQQLAPINPNDLLWESYDSHMGPYEFAPAGV